MHVVENGLMQSTNPKVRGLKRILSQKPTEYMHYQRLLRIQIIDLVVTIMFVMAVVCEQVVQPNAREPKDRLKALSGSWRNLDTALKVIMCIETLCTLWITTFLIMRFYWSEDRKKFAKSFMAIMDAFVVISYFVTLILFELEAYLEQKSDGTYDKNRFYKIYRVMACLRMIKLFRMIHVFNLARYNALFFSLGMAVKDSFSDLLVIFIFIFFCVVTYATIMFWVEFDFVGGGVHAGMGGGVNGTVVSVVQEAVSNCTREVPVDMGAKFDSVFSCMWWSLITITTVGYGDMVPTSTIGKQI